MMRILFDFRKYDGVIGGVEQGVIQITRQLTRMEHTIVLVCKENRRHEVRELFADASNLKIIPLKVDSHVMSLKNMWLDTFVIQDIAVKEAVDVIHFFYNWSFPFRKKIPSILTVHDVIPFTFREAMGLFRNLFLYKPGIRTACRLNNLIATVSEFSKQDISKKVGVPLAKIRVVPNGLRETFSRDADLEQELRQRFEIGDSFVLNVGGIHERKNIVRLIHAFADLVKRHGYPGKLLITGSVSGAPYQEKMKTLCDTALKQSGLEDRVQFTGFVSEPELDSLFRMAALLTYPSLYEGFGIPVLEAMKMGLPVITSNSTAMPEVAQDAAYLVNPESTPAMTSAMAEMLENKELRQKLKQKGLMHARQFTWEMVSERYLNLYQEIRPNFS